MVTRYVVACLVFFLASASSVLAQQSAEENLSSRFVPDHAIGFVQLMPRAILQHEVMELAPVEVASAAGKQYLGVDIANIESIQIVSGMPGPGGFEFGAVAQMVAGMNIEDLNAMVIDVASKRDIDGKTVYSVPNAPPNMIMHQVDPKTIVMGTEYYVGQMLEARGGDGPLPALVSSTPASAEIQFLLTLEPLKPLIGGFIAQAAAMLPPQLQGLGDLLEKIDALQIDYQAAGGFGANTTFIARDDASAEEARVALVEARDFGHQMLLAMLPSWLPQDPEHPQTMQAINQYAIRLSEIVIGMLDPVVEGNRIEFRPVKAQIDIAMVGVAVGLLLPAVQAAREAARRMSCSNNMRQLALAAHNYHAAYDKLPRDYVDADGKPLLSWRVALLPFLEQQALFEQFHLDEPWDSEHNKPLAEFMPQLFRCPSSPVTEMTTPYQIPVGEGISISSSEDIGFRQILDGTSNTVMFVETSDEAHVDWTKPADWKYQADDPWAGLDSNHVGGSHVVMCDGAVRFVADSLDETLWKAILTRAGKEVVDF